MRPLYRSRKRRFDIWQRSCRRRLFECRAREYLPPLCACRWRCWHPRRYVDRLLLCRSIVIRPLHLYLLVASSRRHPPSRCRPQSWARPSLRRRPSSRVRPHPRVHPSSRRRPSSRVRPPSRGRLVLPDVDSDRRAPPSAATAELKTWTGRCVNTVVICRPAVGVIVVCRRRTFRHPMRPSVSVVATRTSTSPCMHWVVS